MTLHFDPPFLPLQTGCVALLMVGAAFALYARWEWRQRARRHFGLFALRGAVILLPAFILLNPVVRLSAPQKASKAPFLLLFDTSRSMDTADVSDGSDSDGGKETRRQAAKRAVLENRVLLDALALRYDVRCYGFDARAVAQSPDALRQLPKSAGDRTDIGAALTQALNATGATAQAGNPAQGGVLLVSDGRDNGTGTPLDAARAAKSLGFPVYTLCFGQEQKGRDLQLLAKRPQVFSAPGQAIELAGELRDTGIQNARVRIDLLKEGRRIESRVVAVRPGTQEVAFSVTEKAKGFYRYAMACETARGEANALNNRANLFLNVMDTRARVLLLEGSPSWDAKFLAQTLRADRTLTLDSIYQLTANRPFALSGSADRTTLSVPRTVEEFGRYDVVILGKGYESFFDTAATEALKAWVRDKGGDVIFLRGRPEENTPALRDLEPLTFSDQEIESARVRLTEAGRLHPGFAFSGAEDAQTVVQKLPSLISATRVEGEKALAIVLARAQAGETTSDANAPEMAMLAYQRYGQGKTVALVGQGLWRWAFLPPELAQYGHVYNEFWTQMIRWLVSESDFLPGRNIALHTDRTSYDSKETVTFLGYLRGAKPAAPPQITLTLPDGKTERIVPAFSDGKTADFTATFRPTLPGEYVATVPPLPGSEKSVPAAAAFTVYPGQEEDANRSADPELMRQIAAIGGGETLTPGTLPTLPDKLRAAELAAARTEEPQTAWDRGWVLALLIGLLTAEWLLRRRLGLA